MTKLFLPLAILATVSLAHASRTDEEIDAIRSRSEALDRELIRARRVLKGKGGGIGDFSMSFDMSLPPPKKGSPKQPLPKKKTHDASKQGMAKLSKAPKEPKAPKESKVPKGAKAHKAHKSPLDELFPPGGMSMSMATEAPSASVVAPTTPEAPTAAPVAGTDTMAPVARRRKH